jgi:hypothetical protein
VEWKEWGCSAEMEEGGLDDGTVGVVRKKKLWDWERVCRSVSVAAGGPPLTTLGGKDPGLDWTVASHWPCRSSSFILVLLPLCVVLMTFFFFFLN